MTSISYTEAQQLPLHTDAEIEARVADLIGRANSRQLWLLFLDDLDVQLPLVIPIESLPSQPPPGEADRVVELLDTLMGEIGASAVVTVLERYGPATMTPQDLAWARALRDCCAQRSLCLRAQLLSHRGGVRSIGDDELVG